MAENNSSAPLKTAEGAAHPHLVALRTIAEYPATDSLMNMDAANMRRIAAQAVEAQAPAAVAVPATKLASLVKELRMIAAVQEPEYPNFQIVIEEAAKVLEGATPALPATEDSSAGDLAEVPDGFGSAEHWKEKAQYWAGVAHELRGQALRGEPVDGIIQPSSQAEVQAEPVAWLHTDRLGGVQAFTNEPPPSLKAKCRPLYTAPQAQPADARLQHHRDSAELRSLCVARDQARRERDLCKAEIAGLQSSCANLGLLVDELRPNAERYDFLREQDLDAIKNGGVFAGKTPDNVVLNGDDLDAAIDAAMAAAQEGGNAAKEA